MISNDSKIRVTYRFPAGTDLEKMARMVAIGQSAGTWSPKFESRKDHLSGHLAEVVALFPSDNGVDWRPSIIRSQIARIRRGPC